MGLASEERVASGEPVPVSRRLLVVDDDEGVREIIAAILEDEGYEVNRASSAGAAMLELQKNEYALVITDLKMPDQDGIWLLGEVQSRHVDVAVVVMTGYGQVDTAVQCLKRGAADYLTKPVRVNQLSASVVRALDRRRLEMENRAYQVGLEGVVQDKAEELKTAYKTIRDTYDLTLEALVTALDARECETGNHSQRVVRLTLAIADRMGVTGVQRGHIARGALLHDIGKIGVPDEVLLKPAQLNKDEWVEMRKHPEIGARILAGIEFLEPAVDVVLSHQERWDGKGYPRGLKGVEIPLGARIFAVADAVDAITSDRPYRQHRSFEFAQKEISDNAGTQFDPEVVRHFLTISQAEWQSFRKEKPLYRDRRDSDIPGFTPIQT